MQKKLELIVEAIENKKGKDILIIDFDGTSSISDYAVICTGSSDKNIQAISDSIDDTMEAEGDNFIGKEGYNDADWILLDYDDVVIHIFNEELREFYALEQLWSEAKEIYRG